jgi:hypothetical protein
MGEEGWGKMSACLELEISCECGTKLRVYYQPVTSPVPAFTVDDSIRCPVCGKEHEVQTKPVCLFEKQGEDVWKIQPLR